MVQHITCHIEYLVNNLSNKLGPNSPYWCRKQTKFNKIASFYHLTLCFKPICEWRGTKSVDNDIPGLGSAEYNSFSLSFTLISLYLTKNVTLSHLV